MTAPECRSLDPNPLRAVMKVEELIEPPSIPKSGAELSWFAGPKFALSLECGHVVFRDPSHSNVKRVRCHRCGRKRP